MSRNKTSSDSKANPRRSRYAGGRGLYHLWTSGLSLFERCRSVRGTFCDIVAVDGLADKVAANITTPQRDATVSAESDKDKEIARLRARLAELEAGE